MGMLRGMRWLLSGYGRVGVVMVGGLVCGHIWDDLGM